MDQQTADTTNPDVVAEAWEAERRSNPRARARDTAAAMGLTEAQLMAACVGRGAVRLAPDWRAFLEAMPELGEVMALTRNDYAVHEKVGTFSRIVWDEERPVVLDRNINLRIRLAGWCHAFAVTEAREGGPRYSLQIFDAHGTAAFKIYLRDEGSHPDAFHALVDRFRCPDQTRHLAPEPIPPKTPLAPDSTIDAAGLEAAWRAMSDTHDIFPLAERFGAGRVQAFGLMPDDLARRVDNGAFSRMLEAAAADQEAVMIFVGSPGLVQIHIGTITNIKRFGPWQNVLDPGFDLHLLEGGIASTWIVRKPTRDGWIESLEIFDADGEQIAWVFGARRPGSPQNPSWPALLTRIEAAPAA